MKYLPDTGLQLKKLWEEKQCSNKFEEKVVKKLKEKAFLNGEKQK